MHSNNSSWGVMNDALVPTGLCRCMFKWMGLNLTIEMTGHSFLGSRAGNMNGLWQWRLSDWCPLRKSQQICGERRSKTIPVINVSVWRIHGLWYFSEPGHSLSSLPPDPCLKELILLPTQPKWSYLSHPYVSVIGGLHCCWMKRIK